LDCVIISFFTHLSGEEPVNTGFYVLNQDILEIIPDNKFYHITDLISDSQKLGKKIGVYPVPEESWIDIGQWEEYKHAIDKIGI